MDLKYFKHQICDELDGGKDYIKRAIEIKAMNTSWAKTLAEMSETELDHAKNLFKMFEEYYKKLAESYDKVPEYIEHCRNEIVEEYTEKSAKIKYLHEMFE